MMESLTRHLLAGILLSIICAAPFPVCAGKEGQSPNRDAYTDSETFNKALTDGVIALQKGGRSVSMTELLTGISNRQCSVRLQQPLKDILSPPDIFARFKKSVVMLGSIYKCRKCHDWHTNTSTGFLLTKDGAVVTGYHVVNNPEHATLGAITGEGRIYPVSRILAADKDSDIAIIQLDGSGFEPMALADTTDVGAAVCVISHPGKRPYSFSSGIVSGFFLTRDSNNKPKNRRMTVTADYGVGSSGGPVIDEHGNVAGMVASTQPVIGGCESNHYAQMIFKDCVPAESIRALTEK